jgi:MerR family transcriptional regulator, light-induced transcriptional regulator
LTQERQYTVKEVARITGLPPATLRKWEERYHVVTPTRLPNGYRVYTAQDLEVLRWVNARVQEGAPVSKAAEAARQRLQAGWQTTPDAAVTSAEPAVAAQYRHRLIDRLTAVDEQAARHTLDEAFAVLQVEQVLSAVIEPVLREVGRRWESGAISEYQEHFASVLVRDRLAALRALLPPGAGPHLITACLPGELHEIGILIVTILALRRGFRVTHLSGSPSPDGLQRAVRELRPDAVLLSATVPEHLSEGIGFLRTLAETAASLPSPPRIIVAGQAVRQTAPALPDVAGIRFTTEDALTVLSTL